MTNATKLLLKTLTLVAQILCLIALFVTKNDLWLIGTTGFLLPQFLSN